MANFEPIRWRHTHFVHHGNTYSTENPFDHEIEYGNNLKETPKGLIISLIPFLDLIFFKKHISFEIIQHAFGVKTKVMEECIPEKAQSKVIFSSRIYVTIWLLIILWSIACFPLGCHYFILYFHNFMEKLYINLLPLLSMRGLQEI
jgi:fatty acid desaturase